MDPQVTCHGHVVCHGIRWVQSGASTHVFIQRQNPGSGAILNALALRWPFHQSFPPSSVLNIELGLRQLRTRRCRVFQSPASILNPIGAPLCIFVDGGLLHMHHALESLSRQTMVIGKSRGRTDRLHTWLRSFALVAQIATVQVPNFRLFRLLGVRKLDVLGLTGPVGVLRGVRKMGVMRMMRVMRMGLPDVFDGKTAFTRTEHGPWHWHGPRARCTSDLDFGHRRSRFRLERKRVPLLLPPVHAGISGVHSRLHVRVAHFGNGV